MLNTKNIGEESVDNIYFIWHVKMIQNVISMKISIRFFNFLIPTLWIPVYILPIAYET